MIEKENLNLAPFYYVDSMKIIDDPIESFDELMKYDKEKTEVELFLKDCSLKDFLWIIMSLFKDQYANGALLSALITETIQKEEKEDGNLYSKRSLYRNDVKAFQFKYNTEDHFEYLVFEISDLLEDITDAVEDLLNDKQYLKNNHRYILNSDSGIDYIEASPSFFKLKANMKRSKRFH